MAKDASGKWQVKCKPEPVLLSHKSLCFCLPMATTSSHPLLVYLLPFESECGDKLLVFVKRAPTLRRYDYKV